jgi:hypothetical protein
MGLSELLFGDKTPVATPVNTSTTSTQGTPEEQAARAQVRSAAQNAFAQSQAASQAYAGTPGIAGPSQVTLGAEQMALGAVPQLQGMLPGMQSAYNFGLNAADVTQNPMLAKAIQGAINPMLDQFSESGGVLQNIRSGAQQAGQYAGSRQGIAEGLAAGKLSRNIGDLTSSMMSDAYKTGLNTMTQSMQLTPTVQSAMMMPSTTQAAVGQAQDVRAQQVLDDAAQRELWKINAPWQPVTNLANLIYGGGTTSSTTNAQGQAITPSQDTGLLGKASQLASLGSAVMGLKPLFS